MNKAPRIYKLPINLQFFAEDGGENGGDKKPSYEDLVKQLAAQKAEYEKLKRANDTNSAQVAEYKKQLRSFMDDKQREEAERQDAEDERTQKIADLEKRLAERDAIDKFRSLGMDDELAKEAAKYEAEGDTDKVTECFKKHIEAVKADEYQRFLDGRKEPAGGRGDQKNTMAEEYAKAAAHASGNANADIINQYTLGR